MEIESKNQDGILIMNITGDVNLKTSPDVRKALGEELGSKPGKVIVNMIGVDYIDSSGLATMVEGLQKTRSYSGEFHIASLQPKVKEIFEMWKNNKIKSASNISNKNIELSVELLSKNAWENSLMTYLDDVPFHFAGKGEQCIIKTKLALSHKKSKEASIILLEEPENHLTHSRLNQLIHNIKSEHQDKQIIISTHSSFVANKLGLDNLILLNDLKSTRFNDLKPDTKNFFEKIAGYDTLRLILCKKAILVEGDSDELIVQKAYMVKNDGVLPIQNDIDVISVGTSFLRFLEIAEKINKPVVVLTDNDGKVDALKKTYEKYLGHNAKNFIKICFDETIDSGDLEIGKDKTAFNYNTLEPKILKQYI